MISFAINNSMFIQPRNTPESAWIGHIPFAAWLVENMRPDILVELGTHRGASYLAFCQAIQACAAPTRCYAVDTWQGDEHAGEYGDEVFLPLLDYHQRNYADFSSLMRMRFEEAVEYFDDGTVDVLHIDGLHTYEAVRGDFETWKPKLSKRAVVLFHDINVRERGFGVWKYWEEMRTQYPSFAFTHTHGLGVLLVGPEQRQPLLNLCSLNTENGDAVLANRLFDQLGKLISANIDIGTLAREQGRLGGLIHEREVTRDGLQRENGLLRAEIAEFQARLDHRTSEYQAVLARNQELVSSAEAEGVSDQLRIELERIQSLLGEKEAEAQNLHGQLERSQSQLVESGADSQRLNAALRESNAQLERMRLSLSWRLMGPFRRLRRMFG